MQRLLLILPSATYRAPDFIAAARELGVAVTVASEPAAAMSTAIGERALTLRSPDLPCVVKPLSLSGSRGVIRADAPEQARAAAERVRGILACGGRPLTWAARARPADLHLRAGPPAVARRVAGRRATARGARGPLPGLERAALGSRRTGLGAGCRLLGADAHCHAPGDERGPPGAPRAPAAADLLLWPLCPGEPRAGGRRARWARDRR
jgi:hypothetical protein